mmetsp:Transcript_45574/g.114874  ORF Transcript_45574/g.114874 Transcript_45574/m.114874 type:complete len:356 (-) Transcript_45574:57-1124(-)
MAAVNGGGSQGVVKSWNGAKGYGFINSDDYAGDIMFSRNELPEDAREVQGKFLQGKMVFFEAVEGQDGRAKAGGVQLLAVEGQALTGKIKSFSEKNGYGFITSSSLQTDVRFQASDLPPSMPPGTNLQGQLMTFFPQARPDGKMMAQKLSFQQAPGKNAGMAFGGFAGKGCGKGSFTVAARAGPQANGSMMSGTVKSFSSKNGYGFILCPGQQGDIKFGINDLSSDAIEPGVAVSFMAAVGPDGRIQAKNVQPQSGMKRGSGPILPTSAKRINVGGGAYAGGGGDGQWITGTVKSYNSGKGFGFISSPGQPMDIYFATASISPQAVQAITIGQGVTCELNYALDGKLRAKNVDII